VKSILQNYFEEWLPMQQKIRGTGNYPEKVVPGHVHAISTVLEKLNFPDIKQHNLFFYEDYNEFKIIYQRILSSPKFIALVKKVGHYRRPLELYAEFFEEYSLQKTSKDLVVPQLCTHDEFKKISEVIVTRREIAAKEITPHQAKIQNALALLLAKHFVPFGYKVYPEKDRVDIQLVSSDGVATFIEIKPAPSAKVAIRQALGQLLEYAHYPHQNKARHMVIVNDIPPLDDDILYLAHIATIYGIPIFYFYWPGEDVPLSADEINKFVVNNDNILLTSPQ